MIQPQVWLIQWSLHQAWLLAIPGFVAAAVKQLLLSGKVPKLNQPLFKGTFVDNGNWPNSTLYVLFGNFLVVSLMGSLLHFLSLSLSSLSLYIFLSLCLDVLSLGYYQSRQAGGRKSLKQTLLSSFYLWIIFCFPCACLILSEQLSVFCMYSVQYEIQLTFSVNVYVPHYYYLI